MHKKSKVKSEISADNANLMRMATYASVGVAFILIAIKIYAWLMTDSVSVMSSLVDSILDILVSMLNLLAVRYALMPPDEDHRFGHTSAEDVAALAQSAFIAGSALLIIISATGRFSHSETIQNETIGIVIMVISIIFTFLLVAFQRYVAKKTGSTAIYADSLHYVGDVLANFAVIVALILSVKFDIAYADPIFALLIAAYIILNAWKIGKLAFDKLMDKEFPPEEKRKICEFVMNYDGVMGVHDLKTRYSGIKPFIQFHLELDGRQSLNDAHKIADGIEQKLMELFPGGEIIIHEDPV